MCGSLLLKLPSGPRGRKVLVSATYLYVSICISPSVFPPFSEDLASKNSQYFLMLFFS